MTRAGAARARAAFLQACELDVAVRKPGNVSDASPGHGMQAALFRASAAAAADALFACGARVGERVEAAVAATWAVAGCNTNLGILLLCAPVALAVERRPDADTAATLRTALQAVLQELDVQDARAAYRAIAQANPGGLGAAPAQDVHAGPSVDLRSAMALAADRDSIARQYRDAYQDVFDIGLPVLAAARACAPTLAVQCLYLGWLGAFPDSHIVRKQGPQMAQTVMKLAQGWQQRVAGQMAVNQVLDEDPDYRAWDAALKATGINPGTTADLTVVTLMMAGLLRGGLRGESGLGAAAWAVPDLASRWHGS